tara:strand:+ start:679 stop:2328 length:1650 start_codon:yes stop_codon:yes gene_type:complete
MLNIIKKKQTAIIDFAIPLILILIGFAIYKDYGISIDEEITRKNGLVSIKYICDFLLSQYNCNFESIKNIANLKDYSDRQYGVFFEILLIGVIEILLEIKDFSEIFYYRHLANHYLFLISVICFYFLCLEIFKNKLYSFFGASILYTSPRIFAESFYNGKDLAFLSFFIFLIFFSIKFIKKPNYNNAILLSLFASIATNLRIVAIYVPILVILFFILEFLMKNKIDKKKINVLFFFLIFKFIFLYIFWPFLWENPIDNFIYTLTSFSKFTAWNAYVFYLGDFYKVFYLPWHYLFINFFATTPILISILITCGLFQINLRFFKRLINIDEKNLHKDIWRSEKEKIFLFLFFLIFIPIFLIFLLDSVVYSGWRHLFFLYPPLILMLVYFIDTFNSKYRNKKISIFIKGILTIVLLNNIYNLITLHPHQYVYFNSFFEKKANKLFEIDYWGLSNKSALENLIKNNIKKDIITIGVASSTNLYLSQKMLPENYRNKVLITGQNFADVDFIYNTNYFMVNPKYDDKYKIPKNYRKYNELKKGKILINEFYKKKR